MTGAGRPLRFLAALLGGWTVVRAALLWPTIGSLPDLARVIAPPVAAATLSPEAVPHAPERIAPADPPHAAVLRRSSAPLSAAAEPAPIALRAAPSAPVVTPIASPPRQPPPLRPAPLATPPNRLAGSAWLIARGGRSEALVGGQLGASQAGARITYALGHRIALAGRVSAPLRARGAEAAIGLDWQPNRAPIHLIAEQRLALDGGRGGTALFVIGGLDPTPVALGFTIDAYGQAGGIRRRDGIIGFADGATRLARQIARVGKTRLEFGAGAWGGAQPGASRLDLGPTAALILPVGGKAVRMALDWRQRVAGRARPGSGAALSIGSDF